MYKDTLKMPGGIDQTGGRRECRAPERARWPRAVRLPGTVTLVLGLTASLMAGAALAGGSSATSRWKVEATPNPAVAGVSFLSSVACPSRRTCIAVGGSSRTLSSPGRTLVERWSGRRWRIGPIPTPKGTSDTLSGVSCSSRRACTAVGSAFRVSSKRQVTLIEHWDGTRWRVQRSPAVKATDSSLQGVSCPSRNACVAVGYSQIAHAIVERWNGRSWHRETVPRSARGTRFFAVSCSSTRACVAVGDGNAGGATRPFAMSWNGRRWRVAKVPLPHAEPMGEFDAVSCTSATACTAAGDKFNPSGRAVTLAERWNGRSWRIERTVNPGDYSASFNIPELDGISCTAVASCTAIGEYSPGGSAAYFLEVWNGRRWQLEPVPRPADFAHGALLAISCAGKRCTAVGAYTGNVRIQVTMAVAG